MEKLAFAAGRLNDAEGKAEGSVEEDEVKEEEEAAAATYTPAAVKLLGLCRARLVISTIFLCRGDLKQALQNTKTLQSECA